MSSHVLDLPLKGRWCQASHGGPVPMNASGGVRIAVDAVCAHQPSGLLAKRVQHCQPGRGHVLFGSEHGLLGVASAQGFDEHRVLAQRLHPAARGDRGEVEPSALGQRAGEAHEGLVLRAQGDGDVELGVDLGQAEPVVARALTGENAFQDNELLGAAPPIVPCGLRPAREPRTGPRAPARCGLERTRPGAAEG